MNKPILRNDIEYNFWKYEIDTHKSTIRLLIAAQTGKGLNPQDAKREYEESLKEVKRFVWYALGLPCPF